MLILILYHKYAVTALVGFLFFHTIHYVTCLRAEFITYTLSDWKDAVHKLFGCPCQILEAKTVCAALGGPTLFLVCVFRLDFKRTSMITCFPLKKRRGGERYDDKTINPASGNESWV